MSINCDKCKRSFTTPYSLKRHLNKKNPCDIILKCQRCHKIYKSKSDLLKHQNRKFPCKTVSEKIKIFDKKFEIEKEKLKIFIQKKDKMIELEKLKNNNIDGKLEIKTNERLLNKGLELAQSQIELEKVKKACIKETNDIIHKSDNLSQELNELKEENNNLRLQIQYLQNKYTKAFPRVQYVEKYVIYIIVNDALKTKEQVKIGMTCDLTDRLSTYNTSCQHKVLYHRSCKDEETMIIVDKLIKKRLSHCRSQANREYFIGELDYLIKNIDECIDFII
jgi:hypothetical protein